MAFKFSNRIFQFTFCYFGILYGLQKNIEKRVQHHVNHDDNYDEIDKMDDRHDLYSPDVPQEEIIENPTKEQIKQMIKENKPKGNYIKNFIGGLSGMASLYRLAGYVGLVIGFFYLNNNGYLHVFSYVLGFLIVPVSAIILTLFIKKQEQTIGEQNETTI